MRSKNIKKPSASFREVGRLFKRSFNNTIVSAYLVSFANFGTVGIITGSLKAISEKQGAYVAKFSMKLLLGATLASVLTGTIVGLYF
ncbi:nucleoside permease NupC [Ligilactobacillus animalis KCTC 3501 = DSM 20602]|nr:nucleoside permease NupC [Ligilactobacillus animalis KCTC 3501 = DSM 20602]